MQILGTTVASPAAFASLGPEIALRAATRVAREASWASALAQLAARIEALAAFRGSPAQRSALCNTYVVCITAYPAMLTPPMGGRSLPR